MLRTAPKGVCARCCATWPPRRLARTLPADAEGGIAQKTEELVGPYELHDFFLYRFVRQGFPPAKILFLAERAFGRRYDRATILRWMKTFFSRFFSQQFKRSAMPDGPKVGSVALSPRGDWRMPSDASAAVWARRDRPARKGVNETNYRNL